MYLPDGHPMSTDDVDIMGVCFGPQESYFGLQRFEGRDWQDGHWDCVYYEVRKFVHLLLKSNPNVLSLLWLPPEFYIQTTDAGQQLIANRALFSTRYAYNSFCGYAKGQLHKMTHGGYQGYMGSKRKLIVQQYGYDVKNAAHLIRLLRTGKEFLETGELHVHRCDAPELLQIKCGEWPLGQVQREAERLFVEIEDAHVFSPLPDRPPKDEVERLLVSIVRDHLAQTRSAS
jgi:predicted nucleotidyltransferase